MRLHARLRRFVSAQASPLGPGILYLLRDEFITDDDAPMTSPRTCEPGPGTLTIVDASSKLSISGDVLVHASGATSTIYRNSQSTVTPGLALLMEVTALAASASDDMGWSASDPPVQTDGKNADISIFSGELLLSNARNSARARTSIGVTGALPARVIIVRQTSTTLWIVGGVVAMIWRRAPSTGTYPYILFGTTATNIGYFREVVLGAPWSTDMGVATSYLAGARSAGDTVTHEADCLVEMGVTTRPSSGQIELRIRVQDASNYWQVTVDSTGALDLDEVVAGTPTQRGTAAGVVTNGDDVCVRCVGSTIGVWDSDGIRINYASATNFATETDAELETLGTGGAVTDIHAFPYTLSGAALTELQQY